jgi:hypothetical protein
MIDVDIRIDLRRWVTPGSDMVAAGVEHCGEDNLA